MTTFLSPWNYIKRLNLVKVYEVFVAFISKLLIIPFLFVIVNNPNMFSLTSIKKNLLSSINNRNNSVKLLYLFGSNFAITFVTELLVVTLSAQSWIGALPFNQDLLKGFDLPNNSNSIFICITLGFICLIVNLLFGLLNALFIYPKCYSSSNTYTCQSTSIVISDILLNVILGIGPLQDLIPSSINSVVLVFITSIILIYQINILFNEITFFNINLITITKVTKISLLLISFICIFENLLGPQYYIAKELYGLVVILAIMLSYSIYVKIEIQKIKIFSSTKSNDNWLYESIQVYFRLKKYIKYVSIACIDFDPVTKHYLSEIRNHFIECVDESCVCTRIKAGVQIYDFIENREVHYQKDYNSPEGYLKFTANPMFFTYFILHRLKDNMKDSYTFTQLMIKSKFIIFLFGNQIYFNNLLYAIRNFKLSNFDRYELFSKIKILSEYLKCKYNHRLNNVYFPNVQKYQSLYKRAIKFECSIVDLFTNIFSFMQMLVFLLDYTKGRRKKTPLHRSAH